jgi:chromosome segregation ATPase
VSHLSDASYALHKDIENSRSRASELKNSLQDLQDTMNDLKIERESLMNKQYDLFFYQESLKKWSNEVKN